MPGTSPATASMRTAIFSMIQTAAELLREKIAKLAKRHGRWIYEGVNPEPQFGALGYNER